MILNFLHSDGNTYQIDWFYVSGIPHREPSIRSVRVALIGDRVPVVDDGHEELERQFTLRLSNPADGLLDTVMDQIVNGGGETARRTFPNYPNIMIPNQNI